MTRNVPWLASVECLPPYCIMYAAIWWPGENITMCAATGSQVRILQQIYIFGRVPLWLCEDITACCYMYCYFRNIFPPWSSQMTILLITNAMYHIRYKSGEYKFKHNHPPQIGYRETSTITNRPNFGKTPHYTGGNPVTFLMWNGIHLGVYRRIHGP